VERCRRYKRDLTLILLDVDNFKKYNDAHGHPAGDAVLCMISGHLQRDPRVTDRTFRYGGEEFCLLLPETPGDKALVMAERVRARIADDKTGAGPVTVSMGLTVYKGQETVQAFTERADQALYNAKRTGKNKVVVF
jgi:diguanylate cyclase (GGDEF)-like protein